MRLLRDTMNDPEEPAHVRRAAAESLLRHVEQEVKAPTQDVLGLTDEELIQVILDARAAAAAPPAPDVPRETSIAERLAQSLAEIGDPLLEDPACR